MIDETVNFLLIPAFLVSACFLCQASWEIYRRNRRNPEHIYASLTTLALACAFIAHYIQHVAPVSWLLPVAAYLFYPLCFLSVSTSFLLNCRVTAYHNRLSAKGAAVLALLPHAAYAAMLLALGRDRLFPGLTGDGIWKAERLGMPMLAVMLPFGLLSAACMFIAVRAYRKSGVPSARRRYSILIRSNVYYFLATGLSVLFVFAADRGELLESLLLLSSLVWGISVRILMNRSDFLPSVERKFELLFQLSPAAIIIIDRNGTINEYNRSAEQLLDAYPGQLHGMNVARFFREQDLPMFGGHNALAIPGKPWLNKEIVVRSLRGAAITLIVDTEMIWVGEEWYVFAVLLDITERKERELHIAHLAHHDALTQLPNRLSFKLRLEQALAAARENGSRLAVMLIDLDRFKLINDTLGHQHGDEALLVIAERLRDVTGQRGFLARLGGDEFIFLFQHLAHDDDAAAMAEKMLTAFLMPVILQEQSFILGGSIGISMFPEDGDTPSILIRNADLAMYRAKGAGGSQYRFYQKEMNEAVMRSSLMEMELRRALERSELTLHYQPQFMLRDGSLTGMEALIRWHSAALGFVTPAEFIPVAEDTGLIVAIGDWVLQEACRQAAEWQAEGYRLVMSVNISSRQFMQPDFADRVETVIRRTGLDPELLCLEITESMIINDLGAARRMLGELEGMGVRIAIDDFGTGYSSLSVLMQLPVSAIKIDRSFVRDMEQDASIVRAIISMGHDLRKAVVAEGVEESGQRSLLRALGCDVMQGFLLSKPLTAEQATALLRAGRHTAV